MAEPEDKQALLTALTTEHFTLQGARSQTVGESAARAGLYVSAVSSTLVALGFIGNLSQIGDTFNVFALVALPITAAMMVAVVNSVVAGAAVAILVGAVSDAPLGVAVGIGGVAAVASVVVQQRYQRARRLAGVAASEAMFPSPAD